MTRWTEAQLETLQARVVGPTGTVSKQPVPITSSVTKYGNKPTVVDNIRFDSIAEAKRYSELKLLEYAGEIRDLKLQPKFIFEYGGVRIGSYKADFQYLLPHSSVLVVEDVKSLSTKTQMYRLRKRMMLAFHGIEIREVA
jgi:hypothetical protein